jgi:hypothetical protein
VLAGGGCEPLCGTKEQERLPIPATVLEGARNQGEAAKDGIVRIASLNIFTSHAKVSISRNARFMATSHGKKSLPLMPKGKSAKQA